MEKYQNPDLSPEERAHDLLDKMSLEEKLGQIQCYGRIHMYTRTDDGKIVKGDTKEKFPHGFGEVSNLIAVAMPTKNAVAKMVNEDQHLAMKLSDHHIPALFHVESLSGTLIADATTFPSGIGQASTWDLALQEKVGQTIGKQTAAVGMRQVCAPVLDVTRDPRFGREAESYGEDPTLNGAMGTAYVKGIQSNHVAATAKHFLGFQRGEGGIHSARTAIPPRELREVYAKPFQAAITDGKMLSIMNSYGEIDGEPVAGSHSILTDLLRHEMHFNGFVVSDYMSLDRLKDVVHVTDSYTGAGKRALAAGMDSELPIAHCYNQDLVKMIQNGQLDENLLDQAVYRALLTKFKLGLFEHPFALDDDDITRIYDDPQAKQLSKQDADESIILLKNDGVLPLKTAGKRIAVIGCHGDSVRSMFGCYTYIAMKESTVGVKVTMAGIETDDDAPANPNTKSETYPGSIVHKEPAAVEKISRESYPHAKSLFEALKDACPNATVTKSYGFPYAGNDDSHFDEALAAAKDADVVILALGGKYGWNMTSTTGEGIDSQSINLPAIQDRFIKEVAKFGKPLVGVHFDGRPISSDVADKYLNAIVEAWTPGERGGEALADILTGKVNPSGKLTCSVARNSGQIPVYYNHDNGSGTDTGASSAFNTYVDGPRKPRYAFGHGLSYTKFAINNLQVSDKSVKADEPIHVSVDVSNTGDRSGDEIVQLYFRDEVASLVQPNKQLAGFQRVHLDAGEKQTIHFTIQPSLFAFVDQDMKWKIEAGQFTLLAGDSSDNLTTKGKVNVENDAFIDGSQRQFVANNE